MSQGWASPEQVFPIGKEKKLPAAKIYLEMANHRFCPILFVKVITRSTHIQRGREISCWWGVSKSPLWKSIWDGREVLLWPSLENSVRPQHSFAKCIHFLHQHSPNPSHFGITYSNHWPIALLECSWTSLSRSLIRAQFCFLGVILCGSCVCLLGSCLCILSHSSFFIRKGLCLLWRGFLRYLLLIEASESWLFFSFQTVSFFVQVDGDSASTIVFKWCGFSLNLTVI